MIHGYFSINYWDVVEKKIPQLKEQIKQLLEMLD
ncbi:hypothetical protein ACQCVO_13015 [Bacillus infantis]